MMPIPNIAVTTPMVVPPCVDDALRGGVVSGGHVDDGTPSTRWIPQAVFTSLGANAGKQIDHADCSSKYSGGGLRTRVEVTHPA